MTREELWKFILSLAVGIPAIIGLVRLKKIDPSYYPFLVYVVISLINELFVGLTLIAQEKKYGILDWNLFNLFEALIFLVQFYYWQLFNRHQKLFALIFAVLVAGWLIECFVVSNMFKFNSIFLIAYSFLMLLLSVQTINRILVNQNRLPLHRNSMFILCVAMVLYFVYKIFVFTLLAVGIAKTNKQLMLQVFDILVYVNLLTNLLYGLAAWYIPKKMTVKNFFEREL